MKYLQRIFLNIILEVVFVGIFCIQLSLNYFCVNNVEIIFGDVNEVFGIYVILKRLIKEGDELFILFVDMLLNC